MGTIGTPAGRSRLDSVDAGTDLRSRCVLLANDDAELAALPAGVVDRTAAA